jgi:hypothetical protein
MESTQDIITNIGNEKTRLDYAIKFVKNLQEDENGIIFGYFEISENNHESLKNKKVTLSDIDFPSSYFDIYRILVKDLYENKYYLEGHILGIHLINEELKLLLTEAVQQNQYNNCYNKCMEYIEKYPEEPYFYYIMGNVINKKGCSVFGCNASEKKLLKTLDIITSGIKKTKTNYKSYIYLGNYLNISLISNKLLQDFYMGDLQKSKVHIELAITNMKVFIENTAIDHKDLIKYMAIYILLNMISKGREYNHENMRKEFNLVHKWSVKLKNFGATVDYTFLNLFFENDVLIKKYDEYHENDDQKYKEEDRIKRINDEKKWKEMEEKRINDEKLKEMEKIKKMNEEKRLKELEEIKKNEKKKKCENCKFKSFT